LKIWKAITQKVELLSFSFKGDNIFVHFIGGLGYLNWQIGCFFWHVHLYWRIWLFQNFVLRLFWSVVKYLSMKFSISSCVKIPHLGTFLHHNNPWSWAKLVDWNYVIKKIIYFSKLKIIIFKNCSKAIHFMFIIMHASDKVNFNKILYVW